MLRLRRGPLPIRFINGLGVELVALDGLSLLALLVRSDF